MCVCECIFVWMYTATCLPAVSGCISHPLTILSFCIALSPSLFQNLSSSLHLHFHPISIPQEDGLFPPKISLITPWLSSLMHSTFKTVTCESHPHQAQLPNQIKGEFLPILTTSIGIHPLK